jgi:hypothetical protein
MNGNEASIEQRVLIGRDHWDVPVRVELMAYLRFNRRMDSQLRRLVARWAYTAPPRAREVQKPQDSRRRHR